jgi:hypothetical protein
MKSDTGGFMVRDNTSAVRMKLAGSVVSILSATGADEDVCNFVYDRLMDGISRDGEQELVLMFALLNPENTDYIFLKDGKTTSPKEVGVTVCRRITNG